MADICDNASASTCALVGCVSNLSERSNGTHSPRPVTVEPYVSTLSPMTVFVPSVQYGTQDEYVPCASVSSLYSSILTPYLIVKFLSAPLLDHSLTLNLSHSYSPPYVSSIEPSIPPSIERTVLGSPSAQAIYAELDISVQYVNGLSGSAVASNVKASARLLIPEPVTVIYDCRYEMCTQWNVTTPFIGFEKLTMSNG